MPATDSATARRSPPSAIGGRRSGSSSRRPTWPPRNPTPLISLAFAYLETDDLDLAIGVLETLHRLAPDEPSITDIERRIDAGKSSDDDT